MAEVVDNLAGPFLMRMVHTRDGAQVCCAVIREGAMLPVPHCAARGCLAPPHQGRRALPNSDSFGSFHFCDLPVNSRRQRQEKDIEGHEGTLLCDFCVCLCMTMTMMMIPATALMTTIMMLMTIRFSGTCP